MKTPTLIVRLIGIYLVVQSAISLTQIHQVQTMGSFGAPQQSVISNIQALAVVGLLVGLGAFLFAARLAKILTLDSEL